MSKKDKMLKLVNSLSTFEKEELLNYLIHSDTVEVMLNDEQSGIMYKEKEKPYGCPASAFLWGQSVVINIELGEFEASGWRDTDTAEHYGKSQLVSVPASATEEELVR